MTIIQESVKVVYTARQMYDLVNDVTAYPRYLPLCSAVKLHAQGARSLKATLTFGSGHLRLSFTTYNTMEEGERIDMKLVDGPFQRFRGQWVFEPAPVDGCTISFYLDYEFASGLLGLALSGPFKKAAGQFVDAFCREADLKFKNNPSLA